MVELGYKIAEAVGVDDDEGHRGMNTHRSVEEVVAAAGARAATVEGGGDEG